MRKVTNRFRAASLAMAMVILAPIGAQAEDVLSWKSAPTTTAWVNPYGECWQGVEGEELPPCEQYAPRAPLVLRLLFELDKYRLENIRNPEELSKLDDLLAELSATERQEVLNITGHTDKLGSWEHNVVLSENRALTIKNYILDKGYPASLINEVKGMSWEGGDDVAADGTIIDLGPLENNPLRRRVVVAEVAP
jgi:OOP family OmpA-OmpF porin